MKKILSALLALVLMICVPFALVGCDEGEETLNDSNGFFTLTSAYKQGYLTSEQVMSIAYYHNNGTYKNEKVMGKNYTPIPLSPTTPSAETDDLIKNSFCASDYWKQYENRNTREDISYNYFGIYGKFIAVKMWVGTEALNDVVWEEKVGGVIIYYRNSKRLLIYNLNNL